MITSSSATLVAAIAVAWLASTAGIARADPPRVTFSEDSGVGSKLLPAVSADGRAVVVLHVRPQPETTFAASAELRVIDVATDRVVERISVLRPGTRVAPATIAKVNARLARGTWTPLVAGEVVAHRPHGQERDSDERQCELRIGELALHYDDTRLSVTRGKQVVLDHGYRAWGHPTSAKSELEASGLRTSYISADQKLLLVIVTYHESGDEERGSDDEEHVVRL